MFSQPAFGFWSAKQRLFKLERERIAEMNAATTASVKASRLKSMQNNFRILRPQMEAIPKRDRAEWKMRVRMGPFIGLFVPLRLI